MRLTLKDVPVDGFWSISVYDADGRFAPNPQKAYTVNSVTAKPAPDGSIVVQFGGCDGKISELPADPAGLELYGPPLPPPARNPLRRLDLSGGCSRSAEAGLPAATDGPAARRGRRPARRG